MIQAVHKTMNASVRASLDPVVLCAADESYVMPLAVTLRTAGESLRVGRSLEVYLLDNGISSRSWDLLQQSIDGLPIQIRRISPPIDLVADLQISHHISHTAYLRLLADRWLPTDLDRVVYLDSDLIVQESLCGLWAESLGNAAVLAVPDIACPFVDAKLGCENFRNAAPYLASMMPIRNYRELGIDGRRHYFNSGVMVMNLDRWRQERLGETLLECLRQNREHVWCWDQYALNVVMHDRWRALPMRWNSGSHIYEYPSTRNSPIAVESYLEMIERPAIVHFTSEFKPWTFESIHPGRELYFAALDRTAWRNWRPQKLSFSVGRWWQRQAVHWTKQCTISYRKLAVMGGRS